jgi:uncharacterized protein with HEPN domain
VRDDRGYLTYILDAIERIERRTAVGREFFMKDDVLQDAVIRRLETLSDAAGKLSDALRERNPEIPWRAIAGFRNRVAHDYMRIEMDRVWEVVEVQLPELRRVIEKELG